jgi:hypothetical protein
MPKELNMSGINGGATNPMVPVLMNMPAAIYMDLKQSIDNYGWDINEEILFRLSMSVARNKKEKAALAHTSKSMKGQKIKKGDLNE